MNQVPVKWVYETYDEKPPDIVAGGGYVIRAAMTVERDNWETSADEATQELVAVRQQLTASEQEAERLRQFVEWASTADAGVWAFQIREQAQKALKGA